MKLKILLGFLLAASISFILFVNSQEKDFDLYIATDHDRQIVIPVNEAAPVRAKASIEINAPVDTVWRLITELEKWPSWQENISEVSLKGNLIEGAVFTWEVGGINFESVVHTMVPKTYFGWTGKTFGVYAVHNWTFTRSGAITRVEVEESLQGALPMILTGYFQDTLEESMKEQLRMLKENATNASI